MFCNGLSFFSFVKVHYEITWPWKLITLHWTQMADGSNGQQPPSPMPKWPTTIWSGLNGWVSHLRPVTSPGLKLPTQSQMANGGLKSLGSKCKIVFHTNSEHFWTLENFQTLEKNVQRFFLDKNVFPDNFFFKEFFIAFKTITLYKRDMYVFD